MNYELCYLVGGSKEADLAKINEEVAEIAISQGAVFEPKQVEEKRKMAYQVRHETHGVYVAKRFELAETEKINELIAKLNLYGNILRFIITKADELPELTSREEREQQKSAPRPEQPKKKAEEPKKEAVRKEATKELPKKEDLKDQEKDDKDLDKKLEEILNI